MFSFRASNGYLHLSNKKRHFFIITFPFIKKKSKHIFCLHPVILLPSNLSFNIKDKMNTDTKEHIHILDGNSE